MKILSLTAAAAVALALGFGPAAAQDKKYGPGVTDTEIKLGQTVPLSGPASAYSGWGKAQGAYFAKINADGGINGRKINLISLDDGYSPPKTVEQTRKLVEQDRVLAIFGSLGTAHMAAVKKYLADRGVPQLFVGIGANIWGTPVDFKSATMWAPEHQTESAAYARFILQTNPNAKIAVLAQNDDFGRNMMKGLKDALRDKASMIVAEATYEVADPTVDSQIIALKASGADTLVSLAAPKWAAQAMRKAYDIGWKPQQFVFSFSTSVENVLKPAGLEKVVGLMSATYLKDPTNPAMKDDPGVVAYLAWAKQYLPGGDPADPLVIQGYSSAELMAAVIRQAGNDLTRENLVKQAKNIKDLQLSMLLDGIKVNTTPFAPSGIGSLRLQRFDGTQWAVIDGAAP